MNFPFQLPQIDNILPSWSGNGFYLEGNVHPVLDYGAHESGWNDSLTFMHEETAGENHPIDVASRTFVLQQLAKHNLKSNASILEIGCSSGFLLKNLKQKFPEAWVMGADIVTDPLLQLAQKQPNIPLFRFNLCQCPFSDASLDAIVALNVLEHIEQDELALQQIFRILKPGGLALIEVPANQNLFDFYDQALLHFRRYRLSSLKQLAKQQGFQILKASHLGFFVYPPFWLVKKNNRRIMNKLSPEQLQSALNQNISSTRESSILKKFMQLELFLGQKINYPCGIRCLLVLSKK